MYIKKLIFIEVFHSFLIGSVPILLSYLAGGTELLTKVINSLLWNSLVFYYAFFLFILYIFSKWMRRSFLNLNSNQGIVVLVIEVLEELGKSSINFLRIAAGVLITVPLLAYFYEPESINKAVIDLAKYGLMALTEAAALSYIYNYLKDNWN